MKREHVMMKREDQNSTTEHLGSEDLQARLDMLKVLTARERELGHLHLRTHSTREE